MKYTNIVFLNSYVELEEGNVKVDELIKQVDEGGAKEIEQVFDYLMQWYLSDEVVEESESEPWGKYDKTYAFDGGKFILTWNSGLGYIGLHEILD